MGPYDRFEWLTMKMLKENLNWYLQRSPFEPHIKGYLKEERRYDNLRTKTS